jgi:glycosyltransferase involved in cell wall biosynthesis
MGKKTNSSKKNKFPFVSICTPTFNRRPFYEMIIKCFQHQTYPKDRMEWIIIDDGTDKIEDLVHDIPQVKYFKYEDRMNLGKKRNLMHEKCKGDIIIYMDDDDYYPPERVSHAVETLQKNPHAMVAGSSEMYIYFKHINKMVQFGPYGPNHATAATFAFRREYLKHAKYEDKAALAEERYFLKDYTAPFVQMNTLKTILVFSHIHNSFDKKKLLDDIGKNPYIKYSDKSVSDFIKEPDLYDFFLNKIDVKLDKYTPGRPENKPEVLKQIQEITEKRQKLLEEHNQKQMQTVPVTPEIIQMLKNQGTSDEAIAKIKTQGFVNIHKSPTNSNQNPANLIPKSESQIIQQYEDRFAQQQNLIQLLLKEVKDLKQKISILEHNNVDNREKDPNI